MELRINCVRINRSRPVLALLPILPTCENPNVGFKFYSATCVVSYGNAMITITIGKINEFLEYLVNMLKTMLGALIIFLRVVSDNRYIPRDSNENTLYITSTGNVFDAR